MYRIMNNNKCQYYCLGVLLKASSYLAFVNCFSVSLYEPPELYRVAYLLPTDPNPALADRRSAYIKKDQSAKKNHEHAMKHS